MEEVINKPDDQFEGTLIDLVDHSKKTSEKEALMNECYRNGISNHIKPAASITSSNYSSAASSSSSSSSNSSANSTSSTSSTLSSPSQSNLTSSKLSDDQDKDNSTKSNVNELENIQMALLEDLGKTATIVEHRSNNNLSTRILKNIAPFHFQDSTVSHMPSLDNRPRSSSHNLTNHKNPAARKKRTMEQPILSEHIPGYRGAEQDVDSLVKYIESPNQPTVRKNGDNTNGQKRAKSQRKKSSQMENESQSRKTSNVNSSNSTTITTTLAATTTTTPSTTLTNSNTNNVNKAKNVSVSNNNSNNNVTNSKPASSNNQRSMQNNQQKSAQNSQHNIQQNNLRKSQPSVSDQSQANVFSAVSTQINNTNNNIKPSSGSPNIYKQPNIAPSNGNKPSVKEAPIKQSQDKKQPFKERSSQKSNNNNDSAVIFADHIKISDDDETAQYTFGFFDEQKPKPTKTSRKSDHRRYICKDNIDANSFNYQQILEFISNAWEQTIAEEKKRASRRTSQ